MEVLQVSARGLIHHEDLGDHRALPAVAADTAGLHQTNHDEGQPEVTCVAFPSTPPPGEAYLVTANALTETRPEGSRTGLLYFLLLPADLPVSSGFDPSRVKKMSAPAVSAHTNTCWMTAVTTATPSQLG